MAEIKNTFIKSKMNKDLDDRLIPNGEYRDGLNVSISKTESDDVGALHTALGNAFIYKFQKAGDEDIECISEIIGSYFDENRNEIFVFITNYTDSSATTLDNFASDTNNEEGVICQIWSYNLTTQIPNLLVEGSFLNFSLTHPIINIDLIENLLFWTDNRNQPRKINIDQANPTNQADPTYYINEDQISVAKYYPHKPIGLIGTYVKDFSIVTSGGGTIPDPAPFYDLIGETLEPTQSTPSGGGAFPPGTIANNVTSPYGLTFKILTADDPAGPGTGNVLTFEIIDGGVNYEGTWTFDYISGGFTFTFQVEFEYRSTLKDKCSWTLPWSSFTSGESGLAPGFIQGNAFCMQQIGQETVADWVNNIAPGAWVPGNEVRPFGSLWIYNASKPGTGVQMVSTIDETGAGLLNLFETADPETSIALGTYQVNTPADLGWDVNDDYYFAYGNPDFDNAWPGDCQYLKDKFVRFAYRIKFADNEYSIISPFTQPCFVPKQYGNFLANDETSTFESTEVDFAENAITEIDFMLEAPDYLLQPSDIDLSFTSDFSGTYLQYQIRTWAQAVERLHIDSIELIFKNDNETVLKVLDKISKEQLLNVDCYYYKYVYQSRAPYRVLPESEITRVSDIVPIRTEAQAVVGNRIVYGNFIENHTSLNALNYTVTTGPKEDDFSDLPARIPNENLKEYNSLTLKQNRTYQVGFVLSDRYGRQSDVILSTIDSVDQSLAIPSGGNLQFGGSTVFHPYTNTNSQVPTFIGDNIFVNLNQTIPNNGPFGYPGTFKSYITGDNKMENLYYGDNYTSIVPIQVPFSLPCTGGTGTGLEMNGMVNFAVGNPGPFIFLSLDETNAKGYTDGDIISIIDTYGTGVAGNASFIYYPSAKPNMLGYYSYKVVVKQQEQDYYNVYLPGIVNGEINTSSDGSSTSKAVVSLFSDNINKVPKDLQTVGPSQTNYTSETLLSLRVNNELENNIQYYPGSNTEKVTQISELSDIGINLTRHQQEISVITSGTEFTVTQFDEDKVFPGSSVVLTSSASGNVEIPLSDGVYVVSYVADPAGAVVRLNKDINALALSNTPPYTILVGDTLTFGPPGVIFNAQNNPLVGFLKTSNEIGVSEDNGFEPILAVAETNPTISNLNLFWETTMSGDIFSLNTAVVNDEGDINPIGFSIIDVDFSESEIPVLDNAVSNQFGLLLPGNVLYTGNNIASMELLSVRNDTGAIIPNTGGFKINEVSPGIYEIVWKNLPLNDHKYYVGSDPAISTLTFFIQAVLVNGLVYNTEHRMQINNAPPEVISDVYPDGSINPNISYIRYQRNSSQIGGTIGNRTIFPQGFSIGDTVPQEPETIYGGYIKVTNGSSSITQRFKEVSCELVSAIVSDIDTTTPCAQDEVPSGTTLLCGQLSNPGIPAFDPTGDALSGNLEIGLDLGPNAPLVPDYAGSQVSNSAKWRIFDIVPLAYSASYANQQGLTPGSDPGAFTLAYKGLPQDDCIQLTQSINKVISTIDICCEVSVRFNLEIKDGAGEPYPVVDSFWVQDNITSFPF